jgi:hypothetical protein
MPGISPGLEEVTSSGFMFLSHKIHSMMDILCVPPYRNQTSKTPKKVLTFPWAPGPSQLQTGVSSTAMEIIAVLTLSSFSSYNTSPIWHLWI